LSEVLIFPSACLLFVLLLHILFTELFYIKNIFLMAGEEEQHENLGLGAFGSPVAFDRLCFGLLRKRAVFSTTIPCAVGDDVSKSGNCGTAGDADLARKHRPLNASRPSVNYQ
jgi:hypothetical protein